MLGTGFKRLKKSSPDMEINIENHAQPVKMLLFVRYAWSLAEELNLPELTPVPDVGSSAMPDTESRQTWEDRWAEQWSRMWEWYDSRESQKRPMSQEEMISVSRPGQPLQPVVPPFWITEYGAAGIDPDAFMKWDRVTTAMAPNPYPKLALVNAWNSGVKAITVLPYSGYFAERRNSTHLVVSEDTMKDPNLFLAALK